jgi:hypothetical protein
VSPAAGDGERARENDAAWLRFEHSGLPLLGGASRSGRWRGLRGRELDPPLRVQVRTDGERAYARVRFAQGVEVVLLTGATLGRWHVHEGRVGPFAVPGGGWSSQPELDEFLDGLLDDALRGMGLRALGAAP